MKTHTQRIRRLLAHTALSLATGVPLVGLGADTQLFTNIQALVNRVPTGDPALAKALDGPKGIATADFDGDGYPDLAISNTDGSVTVFFGLGNGQFHQPALHLHVGNTKDYSLRGILCADLNQDGRVDIAVAAPFGQDHASVFLFFNLGSNQFSSLPTPLPNSWHGARNLAAGDFDGDGTNDLVVAGPYVGLRQFRGLGAGTFAVVTNVAELNFNIPAIDFPKPFYSMRTLRPAGSSRDQLVVTHAETNRIWVLAANAQGALRVTSSLTNFPQHTAHALAVGPLLGRTNSVVNDLVAVYRDRGYLDIYAGQGSGQGFIQTKRQRILVPGAPRAVEIVDLNRDGWNDLVVVLRNFDSVVTFANSTGTLHLATERPVGTSPRELVVADFNEDGYADAAVMNRVSADATILTDYVPSPGFAAAALHDQAPESLLSSGLAPPTVGFVALNHLYLVDGDIAGLSVLDFDGDGHDDVIQLHRASGDFSVRLARADGTLGPPVFYSVGHVPGSQVVTKVNKDAFPDLVVANLGTLGLEKGSVSVRLGNGDGTFSAERRITLPDDVDGRLFSLVPADFNGDGNIDLAAGFLDSRIAFFQGSPEGQGNLAYTRIHPFVPQARDLVAGNFDPDDAGGYADLAGVGVNGELWVVENRGSLLNDPSLHPIQYLPPGGANSTNFTRRIITADLNGDGDLDLVVGSSQSAFRYDGGSGLTFHEPVAIAQTTFPMSDAIRGDFDHDGTTDLIVADRSRDTIAFFAGQPDGTYATPTNYDVPSSKYIATGDLDGDGLPDLVGSGKILWTALSSQSPKTSAPLQLSDSRLRANHPVINEFLAINTQLPIMVGKDYRLADWIELYNGTPTGIQIFQWRLRATSPGPNGLTVTNEYVFSNTAFLGSGLYLRVICATNQEAYHTGWKLSGDGGSLTLLNSAGVEVDRVEYPGQQENVSYSRYRDGLSNFVFNPFPSPGEANLVNGRVAPAVRFSGVDPATFEPGQSIRFFVTAQDDIGLAKVTMYYQLLEDPNFPVQQISFYDDGLHGDGGVSDGLFAGLLEGGLPDGAEIQFFFEVTDLSDVTTLVPDEPEFDVPGETSSAYKLAIRRSALPLELSELVAFNTGCLIDESNGTPDWVEVRNVSHTNLPLDNIVLTSQLGDSSRYYFPTGKVLAPGEYLVVYCDNHPERGPLHAPFNLDRSGDMVMLTGLSPSGARTLMDWTRYDVALQENQAWARGHGGSWSRAAPTPRAPNDSQAWVVGVSTQGSERVFTLGFNTTTNVTYTVEFTTSLTQPNWISLAAIAGDGTEKTVTQPLGQGAFFRVRRERSP